MEGTSLKGSLHGTGSVLMEADMFVGLSTKQKEVAEENIPKFCSRVSWEFGMTHISDANKTSEAVPNTYTMSISFIKVLIHLDYL